MDLFHWRVFAFLKGKKTCHVHERKIPSGLLAQSFELLHLLKCRITMKQLLLLIAVYSLIVNQSTKKPDKEKIPQPRIQNIQAAQFTTVQGAIQPHSIVAPVFSYNSLRFIATINPAFIFPVHRGQ
jgi:hypothetical protein